MLIWMSGGSPLKGRGERCISSCKVVAFSSRRQPSVESHSNVLERLPLQPSGTTIPTPVPSPGLVDMQMPAMQFPPPAQTHVKAKREGTEQQGMSQSKTAAIPTRFARSALFVGGIRHKWGHAAPAQRVLGTTTRAVCRHIGAHLLSARCQVVPQVSYEPSRVRTKVQVALQVKQHEPSERPREARTALSTSRLNDQSGVLMATYFDMSRQHQDH